MTYSYRDERIDPRTFNPENGYLLGVGQAPVSPEEELRRLKEQMELLQQLQNQAQGQGQTVIQQPPANSSTTYAHLSPAPSFKTAGNSAASPAYSTPDLTGNKMMQGLGQGGGSGHGVSGSDEVVEDSPLDWVQVLGQLQQIAAHELAGVCIYAFYAETLAGLYGAVVSEVFQASRDESLVHYTKALEMIIRVEGGRSYLSISPCTQEMQSAFIPGCNEESVLKALDLMIGHEAKAVSAYNELVSLVAGRDDALENWGLSQVEAETRDLVQLQKLRGQR